MNKDLAYLVSNIDLQKKFKSTPDQIAIKLYLDLNDVDDIMPLMFALVSCYLRRQNNLVIGLA